MTINILETIKWICNAYLALAYLPLFKRRNKQIWLVGGMGGRLYADNSKVFYEYLLSDHPALNVIWVAEKSSVAEEQAIGKVITKGSIKNYLCLYASEVSLFSDTFNNDIAPLVFGLPGPRYFYNRTLKVRLNHGNISFKKRVGKSGLAGTISDAIMRSYDLNIASTPLEQSVLETYTRAGSVVLTGSARNDSIHAPSESEATILIAPTWRPWLKNSTNIKESDFYRHYFAVLTSSELKDLLLRHRMSVKLYLHHMMREHHQSFNAVKSDQVELLDYDCDLSKLILNSAILITDYSSLCSERYFTKRPVLFFQFDQDKYIREVGSYIDLESDSYGPCAVSKAEIIELIERTIRTGFAVSDSQISGEIFFVHFRDKNNCKRIFEQVASNLPRA